MGCRPVMSIRPPHSSNCRITLTARTGIVCSCEVTNAEKNRPNMPVANVIRKTMMTSSAEPLPSRAPSSGPCLTHLTTITSRIACSSDSPARMQVLAAR
ncbi:Uncharacterised protein [Mycobacteroides abscessus subsp. abscessus]|nr:Uncharacterised protein [Mycobacteroides abscessus subsp. abscessus]